MGVIRQGILGGFSGKVANVVGSSWKGIAVLKSLPLSVANPRTPAQVEQRDALKGIVRVARLLLGALIGPYWNPFAQRMSGYNAFVSTNIKTFVGDVFTDFSNFFSQRGPLLGIILSSWTASATGNSIEIDWTNNSGQADALANDGLVVVWYNATQDYWRVDTDGAVRSDGTSTFGDSTMQIGDTIHLYAGMARANLSKVSDSVYQIITVST